MASKGATGALRRQTARLRRYAALVAVLAGVIIVIIGANEKATKAPGATLIGVGSALIASAMYSALFYWRDDLADLFLNLGLEEVFVNRKERFTDDDWSDLVRSSSSHYRVLGVANHGYIHNSITEGRTKADFTAALNNGVLVEILWLKPDYPMAAERAKQEKQRDQRPVRPLPGMREGPRHGRRL